VAVFRAPVHAYWNLGAGLDFETRIFHKPGLAERLAEELAAPGYVCKPINLGANTDPYQPAEREHRTTRALLEVLLRHRHPVTVVTKGALILRDLDLLAALAERRLCSVAVSLTTLDDDLKRVLEPRAAAPRTRLKVIRELVSAGVPVTVLLAPVVPALNDHEIEALVEAAAAEGASNAAFMLLRLPHELGALFEQWLREHYPQRADRVLNLLRELRGGRLNDPRFGHRMRARVRTPPCWLRVLRPPAGAPASARSAARPRLRPVPARSGRPAAGRPVRLNRADRATRAPEGVAYTRRVWIRTTP